MHVLTVFYLTQRPAQVRVQGDERGQEPLSEVVQNHGTTGQGHTEVYSNRDVLERWGTTCETIVTSVRVMDERINEKTN